MGVRSADPLRMPSSPDSTHHWLDNRLVCSTKKKKIKTTPVSGPAEFKSVLLKDQLYYEPITPTSKPSTSSPRLRSKNPNSSIRSSNLPQPTPLSHRHPEFPPWWPRCLSPNMPGSCCFQTLSTHVLCPAGPGPQSLPASSLNHPHP